MKYIKYYSESLDSVFIKPNQYRYANKIILIQYHIGIYYFTWYFFSELNFKDVFEMQKLISPTNLIKSKLNLLELECFKFSKYIVFQSLTKLQVKLNLHPIST